MLNKIKLIEASELMSIIDDDKNLLENIDISKLCVNSSKEINWKCQSGHTFKEKVGLMYRRVNKCFYCTGRLVWTGENDLQTLHPDIAKEFDVVKNGITPDNISPKDTKTYWWTCGENHPSFLQSVEHRVNRKTTCPYCSGRKIISGENDLETLYPDIAKEWDINKNNGVLQKDVSPYTYNSFWWICPKGHSYKKKVIQRTKFHKPIDCPKCIKACSTSFPEQAIYYYVKKCFPEAINRYKEPFKQGLELDVYIPSFRLGIEYDGIAFHNNEEQHQREIKKYLECKKLGIKLIRIKETQNTWSDTADRIFYVKKRMKDIDFSAFIRGFFESVFYFKIYTFKSVDNNSTLLIRHLGFPTDFDVARDRHEILEYLIDVEHSLGSQHPEIATMWDETGNGKLTPFMFTSGSNYVATWKCPNCGNTWQSPVSSMVARKVSSCKKCSMKENGEKITKAKTVKNGSLADKSDLLLKQWDFEANAALSPYEIPLNYSFKVAWKCDKCGYKWSASPNSRADKNKVSDCPHCRGRVAMSGVDDLATLYPAIAKEWDYMQNGDTLPSQIRPYSNKKFYWLCPDCGNSYATYPGSRVKGTGCPLCAHKRGAKKRSKPVGQFNDDRVLINTYTSLHHAAKEMHVVPNAIFQAIKNKSKSKGYYWKYIPDKEE